MRVRACMRACGAVRAWLHAVCVRLLVRECEGATLVRASARVLLRARPKQMKCPSQRGEGDGSYLHPFVRGLDRRRAGECKHASASLAAEMDGWCGTPPAAAPHFALLAACEIAFARLLAARRLSTSRGVARAVRSVCTCAPVACSRPFRAALMQRSEAKACAPTNLEGVPETVDAQHDSS
jgi:hypothetical protein